MDPRRTSGPFAHPLPTETYGGFAAHAPAAPEAVGSPERKLRTDVRSELQRRPTKPILSRRSLSAGAAIAVALSAVAAITLSQSPRAAAPGLSAQGESLAEADSEARAGVRSPAGDPQFVATYKAPPAASEALTGAAETTVTRSRWGKPGRGSPCTHRGDVTRQAGCRRLGASALDAQVNEAFAAAMRSGSPAGPLGQDQQDWIIRRDRLRTRDPGLAEDLDRARIAELQDMASRVGDHAPAPPNAAAGDGGL
jgi:hypothetical protein